MPRRLTRPRQEAAGRGTLRSMRVGDGFRAFALDQLAGLRNVVARSMFGGIGLYADGLFFGIIAADTLYFKVDDTNRPAYESAGMDAFRPFADKPMSMSYYQVPVGVLEDAAELTEWANAAIRVAARKGARTRKPTAPKRKSRR